MSAFVQVAEYNEKRMALMVLNSGPDDVLLSTMQTDVTAIPPTGLLLPAGGDRLFTWVQLGEIVWGPFLATCTRSAIRVWEWVGTPQLGDPFFSPVRSTMDVLASGPVQCQVKQRPTKVSIKLYSTFHLTRLTARLLSNGNC